jgi:hypothetical protein
MYGLAIGGFISGAITILLFILGLLLVRFRNNWTGCPFWFLASIISLLALGIGIATVAPNSTQYSVLCNAKDPNNGMRGQDYYN